MRSLRHFLRERFGGATPVMALVFSTLALAGWLGYQALDAAASQQRTVEAVLRDYADIAATDLAGTSRANLNDVLHETFSPVVRRLRGRSLPSAEVVRWDMDDAMREQRCRCRGFRSPIAVFRVTANPGETEIVPDTLSPGRREALLAAARSRAAGVGGPQRGMILLAPGEVHDDAVALGYMVIEDLEGAAEGAYGFAVEASALGELFEQWYGGRRLLPQPIADGQPNDSLLFVTVDGGSGGSIFASPIPYSTELGAQASVGPGYSDLTVHAAVRPNAASQLVIGGLPSSRLPLLALLLVLTLGVGVAAVVQLRREERFQRLREDFVSGVSHEFRTPLAQIRMFSELQEDGRLTSEQDRVRAVAIIGRESRRLTHLVENILQFSRIRRTDGRGMPMERIDLTEALRDGLDAVRPLLRERGDQLDVDAEPDVFVVANRDALTRILVNLLDNALKYGKPTQTIRVSTARNGASARLSVSDQGPGISRADRAKVWKAYRRLEGAANGSMPGTGIGLSVVHDLAVLHGGTAWVEDAENGGARFIIELPLADDLPLAEPQAAAPATGAVREAG